MAVDFFIPKLEETTDLTIVAWLVEDGAAISEGDEILEVETDKAVVPVPANASGVIRIGPYKAGDVVQSLVVLATIGGQDEGFTPGNNGAAGQIQPEEPAAQPEPHPESAGSNAEADAEPETRATPVAQKMAADLGVELHTVSGSGEHGKVTKEDVQRAVEQDHVPEAAPEAAAEPEQQPEPEPAVAPATPQPARQVAPAEDEEVRERIPLKSIRGVIARRMAESVHTTARVTLVTDVDVTELVVMREQLKAKFSQPWGFAPGYNDLLALIVANALKEFPYMNARLSTEGDAIEQLKSINLGMAVDTDRGLMVPVIKEVDQLGLQEFGSTFREMVNRAREGKSKIEDLSGGTFTITSLGIYRVEAFTPVINLPEAAILGIGRITPKPVVKDNEIVIRKMMTLSLVFDHRLTDGAPAARFLDYICELIEEPYLLFLTKR